MKKESIDSTVTVTHRYRLRQIHSLSPAERLTLFSTLQQRCMALLATNPIALAAFHHRDHRLRREATVHQLEVAMKRPAGESEQADSASNQLVTISDPLKIVDELLTAGVKLAVIGGHAVNFHGCVRATEDVDVLFH